MSRLNHSSLLQLLVLVIVAKQQTHTIDVKIGALFDYNAIETQAMFQYAIQAHSGATLNHPAEETGLLSGGGRDDNDYSDNANSDTIIRLLGINSTLRYGNEYQASRRLCKFLHTGVTAIFGPMAASPAFHCTNICDAKEIPYVDFRWDAETKPPVINMMPHPDTMARLFVDLIYASHWQNFTILYESAPWLPRATALLKLGKDPKNPKDHEYMVTVRRLNHGLTDKNYRPMLRRVRLSKDVRLVIECSADTLPEVLKQAQQVGLLTDRHEFIITTLDLHTIDLEPFQYSGANITGVRLVSPENPLVQRAANQLAAEAPGSLSDNSYGASSATRVELEQGVDSVDILPDPYAKRMRTQTALVYDAVLLLTESLRQLSKEQIQLKWINCNSLESWENGHSITNFMRNTIVQGMTGEVKFDNEGLRTQFSLDIVELSSSGLQTVGQWNSSAGLNMTRPMKSAAIINENGMSNETFVVIISLTKPYGMLIETTVQLTGNDRYEGFCIDVIKELSLLLGFNYTFRVQVDGNYGLKDNLTGLWNGMVGELHAYRADLAITDLTVTSERLSAVEFSSPFMNLGISILYRKPTKQPPSTFSFMSPFSTQLWIHLGGAYLGVSLCLFVLGRISPSEWDNPYPCIEEPTMLENQFSLCNSMWFTIGALLQQGSEIAPKATSTRFVASIWWFFTLIIVSSYTANLAAFLTVTTVKHVITSADALNNCYLDPKKCPVNFGAKRDGSTLNFFREAANGTYKNMYTYMAAQTGWQTKDNDEGQKWVQTASLNYAFLMESSSIEYIVERECDVAQVGGLLDDKVYAIAMRKNSSYRSALSEGVLRLQEQGKLAFLKNKWWKQKRGGGACEKLGDDDPAAELGMDNMNGVFIVLLFGSAMATFFGMIECFLIVYRKSKMYKVPFKEEFISELKFVAMSHSNTKTVRHHNSATLDSAVRRSQSDDSSRNRAHHSMELKA